MDYQRFGQQCRDYIALMEQGQGLIERGDVDAIESMTMVSSHLLMDMRTAWNELEHEALVPGAVQEAWLAELRQLMCDALCRVEKNKNSVAAWKARTQELLCAVKVGSIAMAGYAELAGPAKNLVNSRV